ncbi:MAG: hypothetical protein JSR73_10700 [Proteobacteria bacterium]|nr:hypothetical protein [Pseudomonadota bacterium]
MSALLDDDIATAVMSAMGVVDGAAREKARLEHTPATMADVMLGRLRHGFDWKRLDALKAELDRTPDERLHTVVPYFGEAASLGVVRDRLRALLTELAPFRSLR